MPKRIQLKRTKGWKMPPNTVKVDRTTKWGNPFTTKDKYNPGDPEWPWLQSPLSERNTFAGMRDVMLSPKAAIECFQWWIIQQPNLMLSLHEIRGKNLGCWCKPGELCHADILLELANGEEKPNA